MSPIHENRQPASRWGIWLKRADQLIIGVLLAGALVAMAAYWLTAGGHRGGMIQIDRATPLRAPFLVDINAAEWPELVQLPGVGKTLARRIVDSRQVQGPFFDHQELLRVDGLGPRTLERIEPYLLPLPGAADVAGQFMPSDSPRPDSGVQ